MQMRMNEYAYAIRQLKLDGEEVVNQSFIRGYNTAEVYEKTTEECNRLERKKLK